MDHRIKVPPNAVYENLRSSEQEIRLVTIVPSSLDPAVRVTLRSVPHALVKGKYYCLSYAWGKNDDPMPVMINGHRRQVHCNLYALLRRLRASKRNKDVWIDALCIDQDDVLEKASQVAIMQSIYSEAAEVLIGLDDSRPYRIMNVPAQHAMAAATLQGLASNSHLWQLHYFMDQSCSHAGSSREVTSSFAQILDSRWFGRTWVVQETCLAKRAVLLFPWGDLDWELFHDAFLSWNQHSRSCCKTFAKTLSMTLQDACNRMYLHVQCIAYTRNGVAGQEQHITEPMLNYQHLEVTDHRDKIYAFRGLHTDRTLPLPRPDYGSMERTFVEFVLWYLIDKQSLLILGLDMCFGKVEEMDLPSWVPTWPTFTTSQGIERGNTVKARGKFLQCYFTAPGLEMAYKWDSACPERLRLNGLGVDDKIIAVSESSFTGTEKFTERVELLKAWYSFAYPDHVAGHDSFQHTNSAFWVTSLAGIINEPGKNGPRVLRDGDVAIPELKRTLIGMEREGSWYSCSPFQTMIIHSQDMALLDRIIFRTQQGRIGVGPSTVEPGDEVFLLGGGNAPFLLRPADSSIGSYQLIGHGYVQGIMSDELKATGGDWVDLI